MSIPRVLFVLLPVVAGCRIGGVDTQPLLGPAPRTILIWPAVAEPFVAQQSELLTGLDAAVRRRGYEVVSTAVAQRLLVDAGLSTEFVGDENVGRVTRADAALQLLVHDFEVHGDRLQSADWSLTWQLTALPTGALLWQFSHHGHWDRRASVDEHPQPRLDDDFRPVLFGDRVPDFRDATDLTVWLHRFALERLPAAGR